MTRRRLIVLVTTLVFAKIGLAQDLEVSEAWVKEAPPNAKVMAAYLLVDNHSGKARTLTGALSRAFGRVEIHRTEIQDGMARMIPQSKLDIAPHGKLRLQPGGYHLMLLEPRDALKAGDSVTITLEFADGETATVVAPVKKAGNGHGNHAHTMDDHHHAAH